VTGGRVAGDQPQHGADVGRTAGDHLRLGRRRRRVHAGRVWAAGAAVEVVRDDGAAAADAIRDGLIGVEVVDADVVEVPGRAVAAGARGEVEAALVRRQAGDGEAIDDRDGRAAAAGQADRDVGEVARPDDDAGVGPFAAGEV